MEFMYQLQQILSKENESIAVLFLSYGKIASPLRQANAPLTLRRPRPRSKIPPPTPTSCCSLLPRPSHPAQTPRKHHPNRRLRRRKPSSCSPLSHPTSTSLTHDPHPPRHPLHPSPRSRPHVPLGLLLHERARLRAERDKGPANPLHRPEVEPCIHGLRVAARGKRRSV